MLAEVANLDARGAHVGVHQVDTRKGDGLFDRDAECVRSDLTCPLRRVSVVLRKVQQRQKKR